MVRTDTLGTGNNKNSDVGCSLGCSCGKACSSYNSTDPDSTDFNKDGAVCNDSNCPTCNTAAPCIADDEDCIDADNDGDGVCVDSGVCTSDKTDVCDKAYSVVSGSSNKRAKCCPSTSGCIRNRIGVIKTSVCSTNCGSCLGSEEAPGGNPKNVHPETFCKFGQRLGKNLFADLLCVSKECWFFLLFACCLKDTSHHNFFLLAGIYTTCIIITMFPRAQQICYLCRGLTRVCRTQHPRQWGCFLQNK